MTGTANSLALAVVIALLAGCQPETDTRLRPKALGPDEPIAPGQEPGSQTEPKAHQQVELRLSYEPADASLIIELHNTGELPIRVDRELVFMVSIVPLNKSGSPIRMEPIDKMEASQSLDFSDRFVDIPRGLIIRRTVDLETGFKYFWHGVGMRDPDVGFFSFSREAFHRLPTSRELGSIRVTYGPDFAFERCFEEYTKLKLSTLGLYQIPLKSTIECHHLP